MRSRTLRRPHVPARAIARRWRRAVAVHRRPLLAAAVAAALALGLSVVAPGPGPTVPVTVAARDLPAGLAITHSDVREVRWRAGTAPSGMVRTAVGLTLGSPARRGEPITDARLTGPGMLVGQPAGSRAMAVRLTGPTAGVVHGGDRVDLLAGPSVQGDPAGEMAQADVIAEAVLVLAAPAGAIPGGDGDGPGGAGDLVPGSVTGAGQAGPDSSGEVLVVAVDTATALRLATVSGLRSLTVLVRGMR